MSRNSLPTELSGLTTTSTCSITTLYHTRMQSFGAAFFMMYYAQMYIPAIKLLVSCEIKL